MEDQVTHLEWTALKAIGAPGIDRAAVDPATLRQLLAAELVQLGDDGRPVITPAGRRVIVRGSPARWTGAF